ncbi:MAG: GGDEF domain-containing protein, partial [Pseudomonadota bacterium]
MQWISFATASVNITIAAMFFGGWAITRHRVLLDFAAGYGFFTASFGCFAFQSFNPLIVHAGNVSMVLGTLLLCFGLARRSRWPMPLPLCLAISAIGIAGEIAGVLADSVQLGHAAVYGALGSLTLIAAQAGRRTKSDEILERIVIWTLYAVTVILLTNPRFLTGIAPTLITFEFAQNSWPFYSVLWIVVSQTLAGCLIALAMRDVIHQAQRDAVIDPLSGLMNRRGFNNALKREHRLGDVPALVMLDIDFFKSINDELGHEVGDTAIELLSDIVCKASPRGACAARIGGEEFAVLINDGGLATARRVAQAIQLNVSNTERPLDFTVSVGISEGPHSLLYRRADKALYQAKSEGRNCTRVWQALPDDKSSAAALVAGALAKA